jgi:predicted transcriptional regulator
MVRKTRVEIENVGLLSPLEERIMSFLWSKQEATVAEISKSLKVSLSSTAGTLDRLCKHGYVSREKRKVDGRVKYVYQPAISNEEFKEKVVESILDKLMDKFGNIVVNYFNRKLEEGKSEWQTEKSKK